jgi:hypothetical protein
MKASLFFLASFFSLALSAPVENAIAERQIPPPLEFYCFTDTA